MLVSITGKAASQKRSDYSIWPAQSGKSLSKVFPKSSNMIQNVTNQQVIQPMVKLQRQVRSLVDSKLLKPTDSIWKIALLYGDDWSFWKQELLSYDFTLQDPVSDLLAVDSWEEED